MLLDSYDISEGHLLPLSDLRRRLAAITKPDGPSWTVEPLRIVNQGSEVCLRVPIRYRNPRQVPNQPCFLFPVIVPSDGPDRDQVFVCLNPGMAVSEDDGLYFQRDVLKYDCLEDWYQFWPPLHDTFIADPLV